MSILLGQPHTEAQDHVQFLLDEHHLEYTPDHGFIRWSASNPQHPRNWLPARKMYDTSLIIFLDLFTTCVSTAGSTAADYARHEFGIGNTLAIFLFVSVSLLGQMVGGIVFPAWSEAFGRKKLYILSTVLFSVFCVITAAIRSLAAVTVGRFFCGFLSAIPAIVVAGSIEDMYNSKDRVWMIFLWAIVANMGLALGPIMSVYITAYWGWRAVFYVAAVVTGTITLLLFAMRESRPSLLLEREVAKLRTTSGLSHLQALNPDHTPNLPTFIRISLFRPIQLFCTEPIVFMVATMSAVAFALIYLFTEALPPIYQSMGFSATTSNLPFLAICIGLLAGLLTRLQDHRILTRYAAQGIPPQPEHKLLGFSIGAPVLAAGLWWFAWTIPPRVPDISWEVPTAALILIGYAVNEFDSVLAGYLADSYRGYAASGFAAVALLRSSMSAAFPLFATQLFDGLGANVAASVLAAFATLFCVIPPLFGKYGQGIRARSRFAKYSLQVEREGGIDKDGY
ncbi:MFS multidrug transporter [Aspergillus sclerotiicarbonarius CBS 121057]|uniref:MFS multidrug transporter n=1 Tax=Aspergillus sclerotiicarbonarius (strain CBS 121057 / IBT 28362) TaxID=1448318 RepID=A0A319DRH0_ASPSB|nr:MFS multidrug transporter [Aspergillus sclerotiicarbonarius CBS 121057]